MPVLRTEYAGQLERPHPRQGPLTHEEPKPLVQSGVKERAHEADDKLEKV